MSSSVEDLVAQGARFPVSQKPTKLETLDGSDKASSPCGPVARHGQGKSLRTQATEIVLFLDSVGGGWRTGLRSPNSDAAR